MTHTQPLSETHAIAKVLGRKFLAAHDERLNPRPIDKKIAKAVLAGVIETAHAVGFGNTPFHVEITLLDLWRVVGDERPKYSPSNNRAQQEWDDLFIVRVADLLSEIA